MENSYQLKKNLSKYIEKEKLLRSRENFIID